MMPKCSSVAEPLLIVFDLDDTLYPERDYARSALDFLGAIIAQRYALPEAVTELRREFAGGAVNPIDILWERHALPAADKAALIAAMQAHRPQITLDHGAAALIERLRKQGVRYAIVTDGRSITQRAKLSALGLDDAAYVSISEECGVAKTNVQRLQPIIRQFPAREYVMVGDNPAKDFVAARKLGWQSFMLRNKGHNIHPQSGDIPDQYRANVIIDDLIELMGILDELA